MDLEENFLMVLILLFLNFRFLEDSYINATKASDREHVCPYMERHSNNIGVLGHL